MICERRRRLPRTGALAAGRKFGVLARDRHVAVDIDEVDHLAGGEVDVRRHAFHRVRVVVRAGARE